MSVKLVHLRLGIIGRVLAHEQAQVSTPDAERLPARLILALRRGPERAREGDLCEVAVQERDVLALMACLHKLAAAPVPQPLTVIASWRLWPRWPRLLRDERVIVPGPADQPLPGDLAPLFEEAIDVQKIGLALDDALAGTDGLRARRADGVGRWLRDETRKRLPGRGETSHMRELAIGLEHDGLPRLDGPPTERAPGVVAHEEKITASQSAGATGNPPGGRSEVQAAERPRSRRTWSRSSSGSHGLSM
jgi:hypothetical protein